MYIWELIDDPAFMVILLLTLTYPLMMMFAVAMITNPYWKELNYNQKKYWFIGITTGILIPMYIMFILGGILLKFYISFIIYLDDNSPNIWFDILVVISHIIIIALMFSRLDFKKQSRFMKLMAKPLDWWEKYLKKQFDVNMYFKEKEGEINVSKNE